MPPLPNPSADSDPNALPGAPLRILHAALGAGFALASVLNFAFGVGRTGWATGGAQANRPSVDAGQGRERGGA